MSASMRIYRGVFWGLCALAVTSLLSKSCLKAFESRHAQTQQRIVSKQKKTALKMVAKKAPRRTQTVQKSLLHLADLAVAHEVTRTDGLIPSAADTTPIEPCDQTLTYYSFGHDPPSLA